MLKPGDRVPEAQTTDDAGTTRPLSALYQSSPLVLFFYPGDFTPMCTSQACGLRDSYSDLTNTGLSVAGINPGSAESHARFRDRYKLPYPLLADEGKQLAKAFGVGSYFGLSSRRASFLIDTDGMIIDTVRADLSLGAHDDFMQRALEWARKRNDSAESAR